jgi:hypothetical protein
MTPLSRVAPHCIAMRYTVSFLAFISRLLACRPDVSCSDCFRTFLFLLLFWVINFVATAGKGEMVVVVIDS